MANRSLNRNRNRSCVHYPISRETSSLPTYLPTQCCNRYWPCHR